MGGIGSGTQRSTNVGNVEGLLALDLRLLRRLGVARPGECMCDTVQWSIDGLSASSARLRIDMSGNNGTMVIIAKIDGVAITQRIAIEATPSGFGSHRHYLLCPISRRRCEVLYFANGRFASRQAQRLSYSTQNMTDLRRARHRTSKLRNQLIGHRQGSPRGRTRIELIEKLQSAERSERALYFNRVASMLGRSAARSVPSSRR